MPSKKKMMKQRLVELELDCYKARNISLHQEPDEDRKGWCGIAWDNVMCWNETRPGTVATMRCPGYIEMFNTAEFAERTCTENGTWWVHPERNTSWTNYNSCMLISFDSRAHYEMRDNLVLLYTVGYSVSLASLVVAVVIMLYWRRLHCKSNTLHINLFIAFILRASISFMKDRLFVGGLGLPQDVKKGEGNQLIFPHDGLNWECRTLFVLLMFAISSSQTWMLMEGLYLYLLVHKTMVTERLGVKPYIVLGWALPWTFLIPWIVIKAVFENTFCWNIQENPAYFWIMKGPWTAIVLINFFFFLDIIRALVTRVRNNQRHVGRSQYRKFGKFILVLIPLFGIMYIVLNVAFPSEVNTKEYNLIYLYIEMGYNSFQGFVLALLFCFLNEDVHSEMRRSWQQHRSRRYNSNVFTRSMAQSSFNRASRSPGPNSPGINQDSDSGSSKKRFNTHEVSRPRLQQSLSVQSTYLSPSPLSQPDPIHSIETRAGSSPGHRGACASSRNGASFKHQGINGAKRDYGTGSLRHKSQTLPASSKSLLQGTNSRKYESRCCVTDDVTKPLRVSLY